MGSSLEWRRSGKAWSLARASCPRAQHAGSRVRLDGRYGRPGHWRQLYRCVPANGETPHRFSELLPRGGAWRDACETWERPGHLNEGPHAARHYQFVARGIAEALVVVGAGTSYRQAGLVARERARRLRADPETGELRMTRHGQLVGDWVEVFAPIVFEPHRPLAWPTAGSLLLDDLPFSVRDPATGRFGIAFRVFCAAGFERGRPKLWRVEAFPDASQANWEAFLGALEGAPPRVVCDSHHGLNGAVRAAFPDAELYLCEWHLRHALERLMAKIRKTDGAPGAQSTRSCPGLRLPSPAHRSGSHSPATPTPPRFRAARIGSTAPVASSRTSFAAAAPVACARSTRRSRPLPLDGLIAPIRDALHPRRYGFKNRERTNRLLLLMQLQANRQADPLAYANSIRARLQANGGRPGVARRAVTDRENLCPLCADCAQSALREATGGKLASRSVWVPARAGRRGSLPLLSRCWLLARSSPSTALSLGAAGAA